MATTKPIPAIGQKIHVTDYTSFTKDEMARAIRQYHDILTVGEVCPITVGESGNYHTEYEVVPVEFDTVCILGWHYELIGPSKLSPAEQAKGRSENYHEMTPAEQWAEDKRLGILDWLWS